MAFVTTPSYLNLLLRDFVRASGVRLWLVVALMIAGALVEGFGLLMIVPLAAAAMNQASALPAWLESALRALPAESRFMAALTLFLSAMIARSLILFVRDTMRSKVQAGYQASLQLRSAATLASRGWAEAGRLGQAEVQSLLLNDVPRAVIAVLNALDVVLAASLLIVQLLLVALLSLRLALVATLILAPTFLGLRLLAPRLANRGEALSESAEQSTGAGQRLHGGLKAALAQGTVSQFIAEYGRSLDRYADLTSAFAKDVSLSRQVTALASAFAAALLLYVGARVLGLPFPILLTALVLFARMATPAASFITSAQTAIATAPAFAAIIDRVGPIQVGAQREPGLALPLDWQHMEFRGVGFHHPSGGGIGQADLAIARGEWVGVRGPSAAGKTTLADLIAGLIPPQSGEITVDGENLSGETLERWRAGLAYCGQEGLVFDSSIAANLAADRGEVDEETCWRALEEVGLASRVRAFADGIRHRLGQHGGSLSGGERQRLLIARAILRRPRFIILDEATAALDEASEAELTDHLRTLPERPAAIIIAHRSSTLERCDSVIEITHGKLQRRKMPR